MPHKKKPGIAVIISIGKKPKPDMKKYVGDAMPNVMNKAWGFLKGIPEDTSYQAHMPESLGEPVQPFNQRTIHPAITGLMDRMQGRGGNEFVTNLPRETRINPDTQESGRIQELAMPSREKTRPPPLDSPQATINALERDRTMSEAEAKIAQRWWPKSKMGNVNSPLGTLPEHWKSSAPQRMPMNWGSNFEGA